MRIILLLIALSLNQYSFSQNNTYRNKSLAKLIFYKINKERAQKGIDTLIWQSKLDSSSLLHATQMAQYGFFSHTNTFDKQFEFLKQRVMYYNYTYKLIAENLAFYETNIDNKITEEEIAQRFINNWISSKGHYKNILSKSYKETGVNIIKFINKDRVRYYAVQNFGLQ